jgi:hypothetical protein
MFPIWVVSPMVTEVSLAITSNFCNVTIADNLTLKTRVKAYLVTAVIHNGNF